MTIKELEDVRLERPLGEIWTQVLDLLGKKMNEPTIGIWIRPNQLVEVTNDSVTIAVSNQFIKDTISKNNYTKQLSEAFAEVLKRSVSIHIKVDSDLKNDTYTPSIAAISVNVPIRGSVSFEPLKQPQPHAAAHKAITNLNPKNTFDSYVVGSNNRFSHSAALAVAGNPGQSYNPLFIYGGVGLGKTHMMQAIGHQILSNHPNLTVKYISCERFTNELINSILEQRMIEFRKRYRQVDVLLVDDIQFIEGKESTQEEFFHTFNALRDSGRQIVLSSDRPPKALSLLEERLRSRFEWGLISDIQAPDLETRLAILRKKCETDNLQVPDEVMEYIASVFTSNIRELEGALLRAHAYANLTGTSLSASTISSIIQPGGAVQPKKTNLTLDFLMDKVASHYRLEASELKSTNRSQDLTLPRHIAMYLAKEIMEMSFPRIGQAFGNRKHTSALHAHKKIQELVQNDPAIKSVVEQLSKQLRG